MADVTNLSKFLEDVADAIRTKRESTEPIAASDFDAEILKIETGTDTSDADAIAEDILAPKVAYTKTGKVVGSIQTTTAYLGDAEYTSTDSKTGSTTRRHTTQVLPDGNRICIVGSNVVVYDKDMKTLNTYTLASFGISTASLTNSVEFSPYYDSKNSLLVALTYAGDARGSKLTVSFLYYCDGQLGVINHEGQTQAYKTFSVTSDWGFFGIAGYHSKRSMIVASRSYGTYRYDIKDDLSYTAVSLTGSANLTRVYTAEITSDDKWLALNHDVSWDGSRNCLISLTNNAVVRTENIYADIIFIGHTHVIIKDDYYKLNSASSSISLVKSRVTGLLTTTASQNADATYGYYKGQYNNNLLILTSDNSNAAIFAVTDVEKGTFVRLTTTSTSSGKNERAYKTINGVGLQITSGNGIDCVAVLGVPTYITAHIHGADMYNTHDATVTANEMEAGVVAYGPNGKIIGALENNMSEYAVNQETCSIDGDANTEISKLSVSGYAGTKRILHSGQMITVNLDQTGIESLATLIGLTADKLIKGSIVLNIEGTAEGAGDATSDANLQEKYLLEGYSAVVDGVLVNGTMKKRGAVVITATSEDIEIPEGHYTSLSIPIVNPANCADYEECSQALYAI